MILCLGLSPAWQQIVELQTLKLGGVNRGRSVAWCASGKVVNVAKALAKLGAPHGMITSKGGWSGSAMMAEWEQHGVVSQAIEVEAPTRVCTTLIADGNATEIVEEAGRLSERELRTVADTVRALLPKANVVVVTGSAPAGVPTDFWAKLLDGFTGQVVLDLRGGLLTSMLPLRPTIVKPNREELEATLRVPITSAGELQSAAGELQALGAQNVLVTMGAEPAFWRGETGWEFIDRHEVAVVNPIGCGDCLTAGIAWRLSLGEDIRTAVDWGVSCAAANAETLLPAAFDPRRVAELAGVRS